MSPRRTAVKLTVTPILPKRTAPAPLLFPVLVPVEFELELELVPLICFARATKASKLFGPDSIAFAAKTMPWPQ
jgi:hypothetical protein